MEHLKNCDGELNRASLNTTETKVGVSPKKNEQKGKLSDTVLKVLCTTFETCVRINQINGAAPEQKSSTMLAKRLDKVFAGHDAPVSLKLVDQCMRVAAVEMLCKKTDNFEARRDAWTTYRNLSLWFDNRGRNLVDLGFAERDKDGNIVIP